MTIGVDAGALSTEDVRLQTGVWRVTFELLKKLSCIDTRKYFRLYSFAPIPEDMMSQFGKNMENVVLSPSFGYMKVRVPLELWLHPVDVFLGLSQALPQGFKGRKISFIYDTGFLQHPDLYGESAERLKNQTAQTARLSDQIITISESMRKNIKETYTVPGNRIRVCYPGISAVFTQNRQEKTMPYPYFLFVGSLWKGKNIPLLLKVFRQAVTLGTLPHHLIVIGGDYWADHEIQSTIDAYNLSKRVHLLGHVKDEELARYYKGATAFVTTTLTEGFCIPVVEAFASGCPVIASDIPAVSEVAGEAGILRNPLVKDEFAQAMIHMATKTALREKYKKMGFKRAAMFSWETFAKGVLDSI